MNEQRIQELINQGEGQELEFKSRRAKPKYIAESIVAFANSNAAQIIVGIDDKNRTVVGIRDTKEKELVGDNIRRAASLGCCIPAVNISVDEFILDGEAVFVITIPYQHTDVFATSNGRILIRKGTQDAPAAPGEIQELYSRRGKLNYERQAVPAATSEDLDLEKVRSYRSRYRIHRGREFSLDDMQLLENLGCVIKEKGKFIPTVAGLLIFGQYPRRFLPQNYLTIIRYPGTKISSESRDSKEIDGTLPEIIDEAITYVSERAEVISRRGAKELGAQRQDIATYPHTVLRELIINAIAHREYADAGTRVIIRWFSDRIEIENPGFFMEPISESNIYNL